MTLLEIIFIISWPISGVWFSIQYFRLKNDIDILFLLFSLWVGSLVGYLAVAMYIGERYHLKFVKFFNLINEKILCYKVFKKIDKRD